MYQEWESPPFSLEKLAELCRAFFEERKFQTTIELKGANKTVLRAVITPARTTQNVVIERKGKKTRLFYVPPSHYTDGLARLSGLLVTGRSIKIEAERQQLLDAIEHQFWESLDLGLPRITDTSSTKNPQ